MDKDEQAIRELVSTWMRATREGDVDTVLSLMTDDVVFLAPDRAPLTGRDAFGKGLRAALDTHAIDSSSAIDEVAVFGDVAYCRSSLSVTVTTPHNATPTLSRGHTLTIFRRGDDGQWRLARDANMLVPVR
ncbi:MAG TPA: SgcJ/EcaC family oxidoreductase [Telluria sp.]